MQTEATHSTGPAELPGLDAIEIAVVEALAYADVFDYPLTSAEIQRYLPGHAGSAARVEAALGGGALAAYAGRDGDYWYLKDRRAIAGTRRRRTLVSERLWRSARRYASWLAAVPFVRMVAVTGSLAADNSDDGCDVDFMIVTEGGCLWRCRAMVKAFQLLDRRFGKGLACPNFYLSERALGLEQRNFYVAHELAHMVPLYGHRVYRALREINAWADDYLPNAGASPRDISVAPAAPEFLKRLAEGLLRHGPGRWLENWEAGRKIRRYSERGYGGGSPYTPFSREATGHRLDVGEAALRGLRERLAALGADR